MLRYKDLLTIGQFLIDLSKSVNKGSANRSSFLGEKKVTWKFVLKVVSIVREQGARIPKIETLQGLVLCNIND